MNNLMKTIFTRVSICSLHISEKYFRLKCIFIKLSVSACFPTIIKTHPRKKGPFILSLSLSRRGSRKFWLTTFSFIFHVVLVDEGREDPNTTKGGRHRPASETPFDGLGSVKIVCILVGLYRGWRGWGGLCPSLPWIRVCMRIMPLCVSVEFLCLSIILSSLFMYIPVCLHVSISPPLSPSVSPPPPLSQHMWCRPSRPGIPSSIPGNSSL